MDDSHRDANATRLSRRHRPRFRGFLTLALAGGLLGTLLGGVLGAAEAPTWSPADDLPEEFAMLTGPSEGAPRRWRLLTRNPRLEEQVAAHAEANVVREVWHVPVQQGRHVLKVVFAAPFRLPGHVFHIYIDADSDPATGRSSGAVGTDYMYTLSCKAPGSESEWWAFWDKDGAQSNSPSFLGLVREEVLYLAVDMATRQVDGASVFRLRTNSFLWEEKDGDWRTVVSQDVGPVEVAGDPEPADRAPAQPHSPVINPRFAMTGGRLSGWWLRGAGRAVEARPTRDEAAGALRVGPLYMPEGLVQGISATPGHYRLRALARTDCFQLHLVADQMQMPVPVGAKFRWVELPFVVLRQDSARPATVEIGFRYRSRPATGNASRLPATLWVKEITLERLGDTALADGWLEGLPVHPRHHLDRLEASPSRLRPGKVVFQDSFIGTEVWLMTQGGQDDHSYVGHPDFSSDGRVIHIGARQPPGGILRTDGNARWLDNRWLGLVWLFPWMERHLPAGADPRDWIVVSRNREAVDLENVVTRARHTIALPRRPGWSVVHYPGLTNYGLRGPRITGITHDTLAWLAEDSRRVATSDSFGNGFREWPIPSLSADPAADKVAADMTFVGGKSGDNWRDAIDSQERRYYLFELNRDNLPDHPTNPYQILALPLTGTRRGPLRVVPHPVGPVTEYVTSQTGPTQQPSAKWWDYAAGFPWSGDDARLLLEDGTLVHMSSLGAHSSFHTGGAASTVSLIGLENEADRFVGTYRKIDRVSWPHEFRRDRDWAVVGGYAEPPSPLLMIDLEHRTLWTAVLTNFHDYLKRYSSRWNDKAYHKPMFRPAPTFSPDFTKILYFSSMLTGDDPGRRWGDVYIAVVRYPDPPQNPRLGRGRTLTWDRPARHAEVRGYRLYHSTESGRGYRRLSDDLITETTCRLPDSADGVVVLTSVEHSGLESRVVSAEVRLGGAGPFRHFHELESARLEAPMVPFFEPADASGAYAVAVTDPEHLARQGLAAGRLQGLARLTVSPPERRGLRLWARVRGMSELERASYTRGWPQRGGPTAAGSVAIAADGKGLGAIPVAGADWHWVALDGAPLTLPRGRVDLTLSTADAGVAVDCLCLTNDLAFTPAGHGQAPTARPSRPEGLRPVDFSPADADQVPVAEDGNLKLVWTAATAPQGVCGYQVYRGDSADLEAIPENLIGSPAEAAFIDCDLALGQKVFYRVRARDAWGNLSEPSEAIAVTVPPAPLKPAFNYRRQGTDARGTAIAFDATGSRCLVGAIRRWTWSFGDGNGGEGPTAMHTYAEPGRYTVTLTLETDQGAGATLRQTVQVDQAWVEAVRAGGGLWIEAENLAGEGGGKSRIVSGRIQASDKALTYWEQDLGHWLEWRVAVPTAGTYAIALRYASGSTQAHREAHIDGASPGQAWTAVAFPGTGGYSTQNDNWAWRLLKDRDGATLRCRLEAGDRTLRLTNRGGGMALDAILVVPEALLHEP